MKSIIFCIVLALFTNFTYGQETSVNAPDPLVVPPVAQKTFDQIALTRTFYVHPGLEKEGEVGWGILNIRVSRARLVSSTEGYELAPEGTFQDTLINVKVEGLRSSVFRQAFKAYSDALRLLAMEYYYTEKIEKALAADPNADVTALTTKRSAIRTQLSISE